MWLLKNSNNDKFCYIKQNEEIAVGRSSEVCQLVLSNDSSISRKHAIITTNTQSLIVKDLASKYGTFVNEGIETKTPIGQDEFVLSNNDEIRFGILNNVWKLERKYFVTCTSTLRVPDQVELSKQLKTISGTLKKEWDDTCEYLTMSAITLTVKVIYALVQGSYIVTPRFWEETLNAVKKQLRLPDAKHFIPPVNETTLECDETLFLPCSSRKILMKGKKFIFFSRRQLNLYKFCIETSGGSTALLSECKMSCSKLCQRDVIVIEYATNRPSQDTQTQQTQINDIVNYMEKKSRRIIPETDISLAFLYKSLEQYCNPEYRNISEIIKVDNVESAKSTILVPETQETINISKVLKPPKNIEESLIALSGKSDSRMEDVCTPPEKITRENKRKDNEDSEHMHMTKKLMLNSKDPENDLFDFVDEPNTKTKNKEISPPNSKKLTFVKVTKQKKPVEEIDDDMFNFVEEPGVSEKKHPSSINNLNALNTVPAIATNSKRSNNASLPASKRFCASTSEKPRLEVANKSLIRDQVTRMLKEVSWVSAKDRKIKSEIETDSEEMLEAKMQGIDLGSTIIKTNNSLIKRNQIMDNKAATTGKDNFKKFRKVHPISADRLTAIVKLTLLKPNVTIFDSVEFQDSDNDEDDLTQVTRKGQKSRSKKVKY